MSKRSHIKQLVTAACTILTISVLALTVAHASHHGGGKDKMKMMDSDGNGSVSKEEFMNYKEQKFMKKDANGDGMLTEDEMKKHCKHKKDGKE
jgi:hypothetical protein